MSTHLLRVIPTDPAWTPDPADADQAKGVLAKLFPDQTVTAETFETVTFIDQGENFEEVRCPHCGAVLDMGWWGERMSEAAGNDFADLSVQTPCCGTETTLNDLDYRMPAGFAKFALTVQNPQREGSPDLTPDDLAAIGQALGHEVRQVLAHY